MMLKISLLFQSILPLNAIVFGLNTYSLISYFDSLIVINRYSLICFLTIQLIIIILTIISFFQTKNFIKHSEELPVTIEKIEKNNEIGLEFFMTYIVPLIMSDLTNIGKIFVFLAIFVIMIILIYKTDLHFVNPILIVLGYNLCNIETINGIKYKCMIRDKIKTGDKVSFKKMSENLIYGRKFKK